MTTRRAWTFSLVLILLTNFFFFGSAYFLNKYYFSSWYGQLSFYAIIAVASWLWVKIHLLQKVGLMIISFVIGVVTGYLFIVASTIVPGSKEHNYVMYKVCVPELEKHYQAKGLIFSLNDKGWKEHELCEYNVWNNRNLLEGIK